MIGINSVLVPQESIVELIKERDFYNTIYSIISQTMWTSFGEEGAVLTLKILLGIIELAKDDYKLIAQSVFNEFVEKSLDEHDAALKETFQKGGIK